jgi:hypothetical protein
MSIPRPTRRRLVCAVVALAALGGYVWWLTFGDHGRLSRANFDRVHEGMSRGQVLAIFGRPIYTAPSDDFETGRKFVCGHMWQSETALVP